jgi:chromate transporter
MSGGELLMENGKAAGESGTEELNENYLTLFATFFKVGAFTFGGGYAMLPIIKREVVDDRQWLTEKEFVDVLAVAQSSPGPVAVNSAVFIGCKLRGIAGALSALLGVVLPSFLIILAIALFFANIITHPVAAAAFAGIRPAIAALIAAAVVKIGKPILKQQRNIILTLFFLLLSVFLGLHPIVIIISGAAFGILMHHIQAGKGVTS